MQKNIDSGMLSKYGINPYDIKTIDAFNDITKEFTDSYKIIDQEVNRAIDNVDDHGVVDVNSLIDRIAKEVMRIEDKYTLSLDYTNSSDNSVNKLKLMMVNSYIESISTYIETHLELDFDVINKHISKLHESFSELNVSSNAPIAEEDEKKESSIDKEDCSDEEETEDVEDDDENICDDCGETQDNCICSEEESDDEEEDDDVEDEESDDEDVEDEESSEDECIDDINIKRKESVHSMYGLDN